VFVQNLKPGAIAKLGFPLATFAPRAHPRPRDLLDLGLTAEERPLRGARKAYDMLVQAESGLASVTGSPRGARARRRLGLRHRPPGMNAYEVILEALYAAARRTGEGAAISISMFDAMAEWMAVPLIQLRGRRAPPKAHRARPTPRLRPTARSRPRTAADILISIQRATASGAVLAGESFWATRR